MRRTELVQKIKEQNDLLLQLQQQLDTYDYSSFPSLG